MTDASRAHMLRVKDLPCCNCGKHPCEAHHVKMEPGGARIDWLTVPLCGECHDKFHEDTRVWFHLLEALAYTFHALAELEREWQSQVSAIAQHSAKRP